MDNSKTTDNNNDDTETSKNEEKVLNNNIYGGGGSHRCGGDKFYKPRMINTDPRSAYRDRQQLLFNSKYSTHPIKFGQFVQNRGKGLASHKVSKPRMINTGPRSAYFGSQCSTSSTEFNPHIPPPFYSTHIPPPFYSTHIPPPSYNLQVPPTSHNLQIPPTSYHNSLHHGYAEPSQNCIYYYPQAEDSHTYYNPQTYAPDHRVGLVTGDSTGQNVLIKGNQWANLVVGESSNILKQVVTQDNREVQVVPQMPSVELLEVAISGMGVKSSQGIPSKSVIYGEKSSNNNNNNQRHQTHCQNDGAVKSPNDDENANTIFESENNPKPDAEMDDAGAEVGGSVELQPMTNPLDLLGQSLELDKRLVSSLAGVEMKPVAPFPPNQYLKYLIPYGTPPPQNVIPVMVLPVLPHNEGAIEGTEVREEKEVVQVKQSGENSHENEFPPLRSLLPSYIGNMDLPCSPLLLSHSPVEIYQPSINPWPHQFMMEPVDQQLQSQVSL